MGGPRYSPLLPDRPSPGVDQIHSATNAGPVRAQEKCQAIVGADTQPPSMQFGVDSSFVVTTEKTQARTRRDNAKLSVKPANGTETQDVTMADAHLVESKVASLKRELESMIEQRSRSRTVLGMSKTTTARNPTREVFCLAGS